MGVNDFELCSRCGYQISRSEQAYIFKGEIVCFECDTQLRQNPQNIKSIIEKELILHKTVEGKEKMNINTVVGDKGKSKAAIRFRNHAKDSENNSDMNIDSDILIKESDSNEDSFNHSDNIFTAKSKASCQQVQIRLPSFIHNCFIDRNFSAAQPQLKKKRRFVGGFVLLFSILVLVTVGAILITRYIL